jgi:hypothetical protein
MRRSGLALPSFCALLLLSAGLKADSTPHNLAGGNFAQNWSNTGLITTDDNWSGVPSILGYRGDDLTTVTGTDPRTILADGTATPLDVIANQAVTTNNTGGVQEIESTILTVALNGSGTADAPFLQLHLNTTTCSNIQVGYNVRDLDGTTDNSVQQVALHYRVGGGTGSFTDVPAAYIADATTGPSLATLVTPVSVALPVAAENQSLVVVRVMTTNAAGNDELIGIDDIVVTGNCFVPCSLTCPANVSTGTDFPSCAATVNYPPPTPIGNCGAIVCAPIGGSIFPVGITTVTCTDQGFPAGPAGNASCSFTVTVADDDPPVLTLPAPIATGTDLGQCGATVSYSVSASDSCGLDSLTCAPASGSFFAAGQTAVNCSALDTAGNQTQGSFDVTVTDDEPPTIAQADIGPLGTEAPACSAVAT